MNRLLLVGLVLIGGGAGLLFINQVVFVPRFLTLQDAMLMWIENHNASTTPPLPETYGINGATYIISLILGTGGGILVFLGAAYLVIILIGKIAKRLG